MEKERCSLVHEEALDSRFLAKDEILCHMRYVKERPIFCKRSMKKLGRLRLKWKASLFDGRFWLL